MAFDIKEDCEVVVEALCNGFLQGRDLFIRELISVREDKEWLTAEVQKKSKVYWLLVLRSPKNIDIHILIHNRSKITVSK